MNILITGPAGSGIQTIENLLCAIFKEEYYVFSTKEYMSRIRGGANTTTIRVEAKRVNAFSSRIDLLLSLDRRGLNRLRERINEKTLIFGDVETESQSTFSINFDQIASEIGHKVFANSVATGFILGFLGREKEKAEEITGAFFKDKGDEAVRKNREAFSRGYALGKEMAEKINFQWEMEPNERIRNELFLNGAQAIGLGALLGGCNFVSSYPMTPSTPVFTFLAEKGPKFNLIVEQAEDEIAAINMVLGSWYAGGRGLVTTSGGGFALMVEALSLAGMIESPLVIHLGQRPGPATGLPTRTEQADLLFSLFAGHGEFPRLIFAPGDLQEGIRLTFEAFNLADKYQMPVIILTDQYFIDTYYHLEPPEIEKFKPEYYFEENAPPDYKRYQLTPDGLTPRAVPGGDGFVCVDSDEHDEEGHITEDRLMRKLMVEKRNKKLEKFKTNDMTRPSFFGPESYEILLISWGSTKNMVLEALDRVQDKRIAYLHLPLVYPLPETLGEYLDKARKTIIIENNYTAQLARLIRMEMGFEIKEKILKYDGHPFSVEAIEQELRLRI